MATLVLQSEAERQVSQMVHEADQQPDRAASQLCSSLPKTCCVGSEQLLKLVGLNLRNRAEIINIKNNKTLVISLLRHMQRCIPGASTTEHQPINRLNIDHLIVCMGIALLTTIDLQFVA